MSDDMTKMIPLPRTLTIKGEDVPIGFIKVGKLTAVIEAIKPFAYLLPKAGDNPAAQPIDFTSLVLNHTDDVIHLASLLTGKPKSWVEDLDVAELVDIFSAIVEINLDFFIHRVLPSVSKGMGQLANAFYSMAAAKQGGQTPSSA